MNSTTERLAEGWRPQLLRVRSRRGKGRGANQPPSSVLSSLASDGTANRSASPGEHVDRGSADTPAAVLRERCVFLKGNYEKAMASLNLDHVPDRQFAEECKLLELVEALTDRVLSASLQTKGWQVGDSHFSQRNTVILL